MKVEINIVSNKVFLILDPLARFQVLGLISGHFHSLVIARGVSMKMSFLSQLRHYLWSKTRQRLKFGILHFAEDVDFPVFFDEKSKYCGAILTFFVFRAADCG